MVINKENSKIWYNGNLVCWNNAQTHVLSHGLNVSGSVFEGIRVYNYKPFYLIEHINRLFRSAEILGFTLPYSKKTIEMAIKNLIQTEQVDFGYIRTLAWISNENPAIFDDNKTVSLAIIVLNMKNFFSEEKRSLGLRLKTSTFIRPFYNTHLAQAKASSHYMVSCNAVREAKILDYDDALILDSRGYITESSGANIFMQKEHTLYTPIADCFLNGITRQIVMKIAKDNAVRVVEKHIALQEIVTAEEVFLTGTAYEIIPVRQIDASIFNPGQMTNDLRKAFGELIKKNCYCESYQEEMV